MTSAPAPALLIAEPTRIAADPREPHRTSAAVRAVLELSDEEADRLFDDTPHREGHDDHGQAG